jgi:hypothetical protein
LEDHAHVLADCGDVCRVGAQFVKFVTFVVKFSSILEDSTNEVLDKMLELGVEHHDEEIHSSHCCFKQGGTLPWGVAGSGPMVISFLIQIRLEFPWGRNLLVLDGNSVNIGGMQDLDGGEGNVNNRSKPKEEYYSLKSFSILPISDLTTGSDFNCSCLRYL